MRKRVIFIAALLCTMAMALPLAVHADSTASGELIKTRHIQFGSYPQTEIVSDASQSGVYGKTWATESDYVLDADLYAALQSASYDSNGDTMIDGIKYRRISGSDATKTFTDAEAGNKAYEWTDTSAYHYFRYDPIVWRILSRDGADAFLMAETALDDQRYNETLVDTTWEKSTIRSWLNGYDASQNSNNIDYTSKNFINTAFTQEEQTAINTANVVNNDNDQYKIAGGNDTQDKIYLLSESETAETAYGFSNSGKADTEKQAKSSTYAKAMGVWSHTSGDTLGNCSWWLRSPGLSANSAAEVFYYGYAISEGSSVFYVTLGLRPVLHLNLKSSGCWSYYDPQSVSDITISGNNYTYNGKYRRPSVSVQGLDAGTDYTVSYSSNKYVGTAKVIVTGKGDCSGTITKCFKIIPKGTYVRSLSRSKKAFKVKWKKQSVQTTGYQVRYSRYSSMKSAKTVTITKNSTTSKKVKKLKAKKKYYVQIRTYKMVSGTKYYSSWSKIKSVRTR